MTLPEPGAPATRAAADLRVALLGTGRMGSAMAERLCLSGVTVTLYNRTPERATELASQIGAGTATTPAEAAAGADVVISMVADDAAVAALYDGPEGVVAGLQPGSVAVDMSTVLPGHDPGTCARGPGPWRGHPRCARVGQRHDHPRRAS